MAGGAGWICSGVFLCCRCFSLSAGASVCGFVLSEDLREEQPVQESAGSGLSYP